MYMCMCVRACILCVCVCSGGEGRGKQEGKKKEAPGARAKSSHRILQQRSILRDCSLVTMTTRGKQESQRKRGDEVLRQDEARREYNSSILFSQDRRFPALPLCSFLSISLYANKEKAMRSIDFGADENEVRMFCCFCQPDLEEGDDI